MPDLDYGVGGGVQDADRRLPIVPMRTTLESLSIFSYLGLIARFDD